MKYIKLIILVLSLGVVACEGTIELGEDTVMPALSGDSVNPGGKADSNTPAQPAAVSGEALYQQYCGSCHGADATGGASYPKTIVGFDPIDQIVAEGVGVMPAIPIDAAQTAAIQEFLLGGPAAPTETPEPTTPVTDGSTPALEVFAAQCSGCHGAEGLGSAQGPPIRLRDGGLTRFTVRDGRNGVGNPTTMPRYDRDQISDEQLDEMIDWLDAFPNPETGEGLFNQYCSTCHGVDGTGGTSFKPVAGTLRAYTIIREGHGGNSYVDRSEYMPGWTPEQISDEEIVKIERYMRAM